MVDLLENQNNTKDKIGAYYYHYLWQHYCGKSGIESFQFFNDAREYQRKLSKSDFLAFNAGVTGAHSEDLSRGAFTGTINRQYKDFLTASYSEQRMEAEELRRNEYMMGVAPSRRKQEKDFSKKDEEIIQLMSKIMAGELDGEEIDNLIEQQGLRIRQVHPELTQKVGEELMADPVKFIEKQNEAARKLLSANKPLRQIAGGLQSIIDFYYKDLLVDPAMTGLFHHIFLNTSLGKDIMTVGEKNVPLTEILFDVQKERKKIAQDLRQKARSYKTGDPRRDALFRLAIFAGGGTSKQFNDEKPLNFALDEIASWVENVNEYRKNDNSKEARAERKLLKQLKDAAHWTQEDLKKEKIEGKHLIDKTRRKSYEAMLQLSCIEDLGRIYKDKTYIARKGAQEKDYLEKIKDVMVKAIASFRGAGPAELIDTIGLPVEEFIGLLKELLDLGPGYEIKATRIHTGDQTVRTSINGEKTSDEYARRFSHSSQVLNSMSMKPEAKNGIIRSATGSGIQQKGDTGWSIEITHNGKVVYGSFSLISEKNYARASTQDLTTGRWDGKIIPGLKDEKGNKVRFDHGTVYLQDTTSLLPFLQRQLRVSDKELYRLGMLMTARVDYPPEERKHFKNGHSQKRYNITNTELEKRWDYLKHQIYARGIIAALAGSTGKELVDRLRVIATPMQIKYIINQLHSEDPEKIPGIKMHAEGITMTRDSFKESGRWEKTKNGDQSPEARQEAALIRSERVEKSFYRRLQTQKLRFSLYLSLGALNKIPN